MSLLQRLKKTFVKINGGRTLFDVPAETQRQFLESLPEPADDLGRSYLQYLCQNQLLRRGMPLLLNCAAIPLLLIYPCKLRGSAGTPKEKRGAVLLFAGPSDIVPDALHEEFEIAQIKDFQNRLQLTEEDLSYLRKLRGRYPFAFYFRFKCMMKLAMYSHVISSHAPEAVICSEEYSFTSSLLTDYCRERGVEHINVMHGEKLYDLHDSFFRFDRCYVWDRHYVELLSNLRANRAQFIVEVPPSLRLTRRKTEWEPVDYTYYLGNESWEQVEVILKNLSKLKEEGLRVAIRVHPLYDENARFLYEDSRGFLIERAAALPLEDSLLRTGCAVSLYSTVLLQAVSNGIPIMIDDLSDPEKYRMLRQLRFICLDKAHTLLSERIARDGPDTAGQ